MRRSSSLIALLIVAAGTVGCQQLGRKSAGPECGCGCHAACTPPGYGVGQPGAGTIPGTPPTPPAETRAAPYEETPQKPSSSNLAPPPPPESAKAPRPFVVQ